MWPSQIRSEFLSFSHCSAALCLPLSSLSTNHIQSPGQIFLPSQQKKWSSLENATIANIPQKNYIFWDITPYSPVKINRHFRGTKRLPLYRVEEQAKIKKVGKKS
jgi:hypothetical protein